MTQTVIFYILTSSISYYQLMNIISYMSSKLKNNNIHDIIQKIQNKLKKHTISWFTLIEILIVISVIGVITTATISTVQWQNERARNVIRKTMVNQIANSIASYYSYNKYRPETIYSLKPNYLKSIPTDPKLLDTCNTASTRNSELAYAKYNNGGVAGDKKWFMVLSQLENGWMWVDYNNIFILTGSSPCYDGLLWANQVDRFRIANSRCTSKPWWTDNNPTWSAPAAYQHIVQQLVVNIIQPSTVYGSWAWESAPYCNGKLATIRVNSSSKIIGWPNNNITYAWTLNGTNGNDVIVGTFAADIINGGQWDDIICGGWGDDIIDGWINNDRIDGWEGNDWINGWSHDDIMYGGAGNDQIYGQDWYDISYWWPGNDIIDDSLNQQTGWGWGQPDKIYWWDGDDIIRGRDGADELYGGAGNDQIWWDSQADTIYWWDGDDIIYWWSDNDKISGGDWNDIIDGRDWDDIMYGWDWNDYLSGYNGNDRISGWSWSDIFAWWYWSNTCVDYLAGVDTQIHADARNPSCGGTNYWGNNWRTGIEPVCADNSFTSLCNTDYDDDGIPNSNETQTANSDVMAWISPDNPNRQDSNTVDADMDGVVNQLDPNNLNPCIPNTSSSGCWTTTSTPGNQVIQWVNCSAIKALPYGSRTYYILIY